MITLRLTRLTASMKNGVFGALVCDDFPIGCTLEPYHMDNMKGISCIPAGVYAVEHYSSEKYPDTFQIMNVANRDKILIHAGNIDNDTQGCIILGMSFGEFGNGDRGVLSSKEAMLRLRKVIGIERRIQLIITEAY